MTTALTKSNFLLGRQCEKALWLRFHQKDLARPVGPALKRLFKEGQDVGRLAHKLFPGGKLVSAGPGSWDLAIAETTPYLKKADVPVFEAAAIFNDLFIRADILDPKRGAWDLIEVKSSTSVKDDHIDDLAIQWFVLRGSGLPLRKAFLLHINSDYVRGGEIDVTSFFTKEDVTARVAMAADDLPGHISRLRRVIDRPKVPDVAVGKHCEQPHECRFSDHCWSAVPALSIHYLPRINEKKITLLKGQGVFEQTQIPDDFDDLSPNQLHWVRAAKDGKPIVNKGGLTTLLSTLEYPLTFLDFETIGLAIPPYDGLNPFTQVPFQASVRVIEVDGAERHEEFLGDGHEDPRPALARFLAGVIPPSGSVIAYSARFERGRLEELAAVVPEIASELHNIAARLWDLLDAFSKGHYIDHRFQGSTSIKNVLPVLVPELSYTELTIGNGSEAVAAYVELMSDGLDSAKAEELKRALREYCGQDTLAMVRILEFLKRVLAA